MNSSRASPIPQSGICWRRSSTPLDIKITDEDITEAERILLPPGKSFDHERRDFIRRLDTIDLHAVPGSGKTTAVLAKLVALDRHMPFSDGTGILAISHTNVAVDQIRQKLGGHCPRLLSYPNFVGTIQAFVDRFLAVPYYIHKYGQRPLRVDNDIYWERASCFMSRTPPGYSSEEIRNARHYLKCNRNACEFRFGWSGTGVVLLSSVAGERLAIRRPKATSPETDWSDAEKRRVATWLADFKKQVMMDGYLCYDDAYFLADCLLSKIADVKTLIQRRFPFVIVDEMQDMGKHQHDLLESLFHDGGRSVSAYQRVGDRNQGIQGTENFDEEGAWNKRPQVLRLHNSHRLSPSIAQVTQPFAVHDPSACTICGLAEPRVRPRMLVYSDSTMCVIHEFAKMLKSLIDQGKVRSGTGAVYKAVAWNAEWSSDEKDDKNKVRLADYCPAFRKARMRPRADYDCIGGYLETPVCGTRALSVAHGSMLSVFLKALRLEGIAQPDRGRPFTGPTLRRYLREKHHEFYEEFLLRLHRWSMALAERVHNGVEQEMRATAVEMLSLFGRQVCNSQDFMGDVHVGEAGRSPCETPAANTCTFDGVTVQLSTVHNVKGETHTATLYLESFYHADGRGQRAKSYESQRLADQFLGEALSSAALKKKRVKQSAKMVYVGFSRPTDLLCFAVHKDRFDQYLSGVDPSRQAWDIILLPETSGTP